MFKKYLTLWLVLFVGIISAYAGNCGVKDSVGVQKAADGTMIILHKVGAGETLYALERKYKKHGTTASKIKAANNGASTFNVGQTVNIPTTKKYGATSTSSPKVNHATTSSTSDKIHVVKAGETMFAITHKYNVSVADVKKWNHLSDNSVNVGQKLIVGKGSGTSTPTTNHATTTSSSKNTHKVVAGETLYSIAHDNDMDVAELKALNPGIDKGINVGQLVNVKKGGGSTSA